MKKHLNVFDKMLHYTENTATGILGNDHETERTYTKLNAGNFIKNKHQDKHFSESENWAANKRKTKP